MMKPKSTTARQSKTLTPDQARAEYFPNMGRGAFYAALHRKELPCLRIGRKFLLPRTAIEVFLQNCGTPATKGATDAA
jgi:excisionase family DNA binding protein